MDSKRKLIEIISLRQTANREDIHIDLLDETLPLEEELMKIYKLLETSLKKTAKRQSSSVRLLSVKEKDLIKQSSPTYYFEDALVQHYIGSCVNTKEDGFLIQPFHEINIASYSGDADTFAGKLRDKIHENFSRHKFIYRKHGAQLYIAENIDLENFSSIYHLERELRKEL